MTQSPERTNGRGMLLGRLRTVLTGPQAGPRSAGTRDFVAGIGDLATLVITARNLVTGARELIAGAQEIIALTRSLASGSAKNGHQPPAPVAANSHQDTADAPEVWWRSALVPASLVAGAFVVHTFPAYASLDRSKARVPIKPNVRWHYPALVAHIAAGSIAFVTTGPQLWTWLRVRHPKLHRRIGQVYVYGGVIPSALLALAVTPFSAGPPGNILVGLGWLYSTLRGQQLARRHDYAGHRQWMIYSYALCSQIIWGRILIFVISKTAPRWLEKNWPLVLETATWIGAAIHLVAAQWWIERTRQRPILTASTGAPAILPPH